MAPPWAATCQPANRWGGSKRRFSLGGLDKGVHEGYAAP
jgi:hypothetical protein